MFLCVSDILLSWDGSLKWQKYTEKPLICEPSHEPAICSKALESSHVHKHFLDTAADENSSGGYILIYLTESTNVQALLIKGENLKVTPKMFLFLI